MKLTSTIPHAYSRGLSDRLVGWLAAMVLVLSGLVFIPAAPASAAVPGAPTITAVSRVDQGLNVTFTAPSSSPAITNYEYSTDGGATWTTRSPASTATTISITGLTNCQTYSVSVRAVNADGAGSAAAAWDGVPGTLTYQLDNGLIRFGNGSEDSILTTGNLKQPFYKSGASWYKLTYASNPLSYAIAAGGVGTSEWNTDGTRVESPTLSRQVIDCSGFTATNAPASGGRAVGYGTLITSGLATVGTQTVKVTRTFRLTSTGKYASISETVTNVSASSLTNARMWVGTSDDYVNTSDRPDKTKGNISGGVFTALSSGTTQSRALKVTNGSDIVYFYTTSNLGYTSWNSCCSFSNAMNQNPLTQAVSSGYADGSYALYLRFQDIAPGASESFNWYYIATTAADAPSVLSAVSNVALPASPTVTSVVAGNSQATVNFTAGSSGGSALTNYQYSTNGGVSWQTRSPASTTSPMTITGLTNGQTYDVQIRAVNSEGSGAATGTTTVTPLGPPQAPQITELTQTDTTVTVAFNPPGSNGGAAISNYEYSTDGGSTWTSRAPDSTSSPITIGGLTAGTSYSIALRAVNSQGAGTSSATSSVTTLSAPDAPLAGIPLSRDGALSVPVTLAGNGGSPITNIEYSIDGGASWVTPSPATAYTPILITGLTNGTFYDVAVRAVNAVGHSSASNIVTGAPRTVPAAVELPLSTNVTPSSQTLSLTFGPPDDGGSAITGYEYSTDRGSTWRARTDGGGTSSTLVLTKLSSDGVTDLTNGVEYCVQVRAVNAAGSGQASNDVCSTPKSAPDALSSLVATSRSGAIDLSFTLGGNGGDPVSDIEYCLSSCGTASNWISLGSVSSPARIEGLTNGTSYTVSLRAVNGIGSGASVTSSSVIPANNPTAPQSFAVTLGASQASLSFSAPSSNGGIAISNYEYSIDGGLTWITPSPAVTTSPLVVSGLTNGTNYGFAVRAVTPSSTGQASSVSYGTPSTTPSAPTSVAFSALSGRISVSYGAANDGGSPLTTYEYALSTNGGSSYGSWIPTNSTGTSFEISGLTNGQAYFVKVRAVNINGSGVVATSGSAVTPAGVPESPVITSISNSSTLVSLTNTQLAVYFTEPSNNGSSITDYQYSTDNGATWRNRTDATGRFSPLVISTLSADGTTSLTTGTTYPVLIRARNANGLGAASAATNAVPGGAVDTSVPTATLAASGGATSSSRVLTYTVTFSESVSGLATSDFSFDSGTATCTVTSVSAASGTTMTVTVTCTTDGTVALKLNANAITDGTNLGPASAVTASTVTVNTVPQATVSIASTSSASRILTYTVDFTMNVSGISTSDFIKQSGTASCTTTSVSATSGTSVTFTVTCSTDGTIVMKLLANSVSGAYSVGPTAIVTASTVTINSVVPQAELAPVATTSNSRVLTYDVSFNAAVSGIAAADFVKAAGTASCSTTNASASSGTAVTFTVTCSTDGTITMRLSANSVTNGFSTGPVVALTAASVTIDTVVPTVALTSPGLRSSSRAMTYVATFSESVSGVDVTDLVQSAGSAACSTTGVSASSGTVINYTVTCTSDGTVQMRLLAGSVTDGVNAGPVSASTTGTTTVDQTPPSATIAAPLSRTKARSLSYTVTFSESVSGIAASDFVQESGTASCSTTSASQSTGTSATFVVDCAGDGTVVMKLVDNSVTDGSFTGPVTAVLAREVAIDNVAPAVSSAISGPGATWGNRILSYGVSFSESVSGIAAGDFVKDSGTAICFTTAVNQSAGTSVVFTVTCLTDGTIVMKLKANSVTDGLTAGPSTEIKASSVKVDTAPVVVVPAPSPSPSPSVEPARVPTLLNNQLPHVTSATPVVITPQGVVEAVTTTSSTGNQVTVLPSRATVAIEPRANVPTSVKNQSPSGIIQVSRGGILVVSGTGLAPGTELAVWLFSTPKLLGYVRVGASGTVKAEFKVSGVVAAGMHTAQVNAIDKSGEKVSVNAAVHVVSADVVPSSPQVPVFVWGGLAFGGVVIILLVLAGIRYRRRKGQ